MMAANGKPANEQQEQAKIGGQLQLNRSTLAGLFNSLSSLAAANQAQQQQQHHHQHLHPQQIAPLILDGASNNAGSGLSPQQSVALNSQLQSVVEAAVMQHRLAQAVASQRLQHNQHSSLPVQQDATEPISLVTMGANPVANFQKQTVFDLSAATQLPAPLAFSCAAAATAANDQTTTTQQQLLPHQNHFQQQTPPLPQQQRINYCTICNKELCNKYFMKTHMIKMHGIKLEMEPPEAEEQRQEGQDEANEPDESSNEQDHNRTDWHRADQDGPLSSSLPGQASQSATNSASKKSSPNLKSSPNTGGKKQTPTKQATCVMNGFAGNSMGGVVCDICNKELCSKYFLKVHKQNTHGIMTDYQDPSVGAPFSMYPFAAAANPMIAAPGALLAAAAAAVASQTPVATAPFGAGSPNAFALFAPNVAPATDLSSDIKNIKSSQGSKRLRLGQAHKEPDIDQRSRAAAGPPHAETGLQPEQLDAVYRLMIAQQQQHPMSGKQQPLAAGAQPFQMQFDPISAAAASTAGNPLSALMCLGAIGPAAMSPAMIVDHILRNQHLLNWNQHQQQANSDKSNLTTDRNNNNNSHNDPAGGRNEKNSKENSSASSSSSNNRYFSHYTEACPMCDRRFKSIKWLKTHMMNDHKQEIGAYMQMMMQYVYSSNGQQMAAAAAAATMAAIEQRQQQGGPNPFQMPAALVTQQTTQIQNQQQIQQPISLLSKMNNNSTQAMFQKMKIRANGDLSQAMPMQRVGDYNSHSNISSGSPPSQVVSSAPEFHSTEHNSVIDARCRRSPYAFDDDQRMISSGDQLSSPRLQQQTSLFSSLNQTQNQTAHELPCNSPDSSPQQLINFDKLNERHSSSTVDNLKLKLVDFSPILSNRRSPDELVETSSDDSNPPILEQNRIEDVQDSVQVTGGMMSSTPSPTQRSVKTSTSM